MKSKWIWLLNVTLWRCPVFTESVCMPQFYQLCGKRRKLSFLLYLHLVIVFPFVSFVFVVIQTIKAIHFRARNMSMSILIWYIVPVCPLQTKRNELLQNVQSNIKFHCLVPSVHCCGVYTLHNYMPSLLYIIMPRYSVMESILLNE